MQYFFISDGIISQISAVMSSEEATIKWVIERKRYLCFLKDVTRIVRYLVIEEKKEQKKEFLLHLFFCYVIL